MQEEFQPMIKHALNLCVSHLGDRLSSVILGGSVAFGEALAGSSDVDWFMFISDEPTDIDMRWCEETKTKLEEDYSIISEFGLGLYSIDRLRNEDFWRFIIKTTQSSSMGQI